MALTPSKRPRLRHSLSTPSLSERVSDLMSETSPLLPGPTLGEISADLHQLKHDQMAMQAQSVDLVGEVRAALRNQAASVTDSMQTMMAECQKQFRDYLSELASQQSTLSDITHSTNYMGQDLRMLHHRQKITASTAASNARKTEVIDDNIQQIIQDQRIASTEVHNTRPRQDHLDTAARHSDRATSTAVSGLQRQLVEAQQVCDSLRRQISLIPANAPVQTTAPIISALDSKSVPLALDEALPQAQFSCRESISPERDSPHTNQCRRNSMSVHAPIRRPPKFDVDRYGRYKEEIALWEDAHAHAAPHSLISEMALSDEDTFRIVMMNYISSTKVDPVSRPFESLFLHLDKEYSRDASERSMQKLQQFQTFVRKAHESVNSFWIRFSKLPAEAESNGLTMSSSMLFLRALQALSLTPEQKNTVLAATHGAIDPHNPVELRNVTQRLFNTPLKSTDVFQLGDQLEDDTFILKGKGKGTNRPGRERNAVQTASRTFNFPNVSGKSPSFQKGAGKAPSYQKGPSRSSACHNCQQQGHFARDCPMPLQKTPAFPASGKDHDAFQVTESEVVLDSTGYEMGEEPAGTESNEWDVGPTSAECTEETCPSDANASDVFMTRWWEEEGIWLVSDDRLSSVADTHYNDLNCADCIHALIDSGASSNVVGIEWLERYASLNRHQWGKCYSISKKRFRFGDGPAVASIGTVIVNAKVTCRDSAARPFLARTDVVLNKVPLLISRSSLHRMRGNIDFQTNVLLLADRLDLFRRLSLLVDI